jgi:hypothetical protein
VAGRGGDADLSWNCNLETGVAKEPAEDRWTVELALPWSDLDVSPEQGMIVRGNFLRNNIANSEKVTGKKWFKDRSDSFWTPAPHGFSDPSLYGIMVLE